LVDSQLAEIISAIGQIHVSARKVGICTAMQTLRTPGERFAEIPNSPYSPHYCELYDDEGGRVRVARIEDDPLTPTRFCCCMANRLGRFCTAR
jgi:haloalkane dehalogenase